MIARTWRGATRAADAEAYLRYLGETGFSEYRTTPGIVRVLGLRRIVGHRARHLLITFWEDEEAIGRFTGHDDIERAVFYPEDERYLVEADRRASHYDIVFDRPGIAGRPRGPAPDRDEDRRRRSWQIAGFR